MRRTSREKIVYARLFGGHLAVRDRVAVGRQDVSSEVERVVERVTGIDRLSYPGIARFDQCQTGEIVALHGLRTARIGDRVVWEEGHHKDARPRPRDAFPVPTLESVVSAVDPAQISQLRDALEELAEQERLISLRQHNDLG